MGWENREYVMAPYYRSPGGARYMVLWQKKILSTILSTVIKPPKGPKGQSEEDS